MGLLKVTEHSPNSFAVHFFEEPAALTVTTDPDFALATSTGKLAFTRATALGANAKNLLSGVGKSDNVEDGSELPTELIATTETEYIVPLVKPVIKQRRFDVVQVKVLFPATADAT